MADAKVVYRKKANLMLGEMKKHFHPCVTFSQPEGGLFVMAFLADETAVSNGFRLNFSTPGDEQIKKGIEILGKLTYDWIESNK